MDFAILLNPFALTSTSALTNVPCLLFLCDCHDQVCWALLRSWSWTSFGCENKLSSGGCAL